ncbi:hypothetical protein AB0O74_34680 [Streptomyces rubiginosohelvolus]|uniref:hypothetical protein n=1 Tax=Streptomyces rubiginosohelvolus TaxID=67362 RepID=UPI003429543F
MTTPNSPIPGTTSLTKDIETPPRSVIDTGTDVMVQHLRTFIHHLNGQDSTGATHADVHNLVRAAERNLDVPVRPTPQTSHRDAYVYWHTITTLTTALRDLYLTHHDGQEPPA